MKSHTREHTRDLMPPGGTVVLAAATDVAGAEQAIAAGAGVIDLWTASPETAGATAARHPRVPVCAGTGWARLVRDPALARRTGAVLICAGPDGARAAEASGIGRDRLLAETPPAGAEALLAEGWKVCVTADDEAGPHAAVAVAAIACWLGAAAVRTRHVAAARRAIDMTEAIKGGALRDPAATW